MRKFDINEDPHRRFNPLINEWVLVSPHRSKRPWQGQQETSSQEVALNYDPQCYLCAGNTRVNGQTNPPYSSTFVFTNDHAALLPSVPQADSTEDFLFQNLIYQRKYYLQKLYLKCF